jgi:hypothetical protein
VFTTAGLDIDGIINATGNINGLNITASGDINTNNLLTPGVISAAGNITGSYFFGNGSQLTGIVATDVGVLANLSVTGNTTTGNLLTGGNVSAAGNITGDNLNAAGLSLSSNVVSDLNVTANIAGGNITTPGIISAQGNITGGNVSAVSITGTIVSASGNITGANVNTGQVYNPTTLTITTGSGNLNLQPVANIVLNNTYINSVGYPVLDQDAASKLYVDTVASTGLIYHTGVVAATTTDLATTTGGTITYDQPNGAGNGVGATLTTTGSFDLIDTANVQTAGTRILVKDQANAVQNGVYVWSNATVITRSTDADTYGVAPNTLSLNDYFFVSSGNINLGSSYVVSAPIGTITFGTSNIEFAQFSSVQIYSANSAAGLSLLGTVFSAKVDNNTTAFDVGGNISVKANANLTTPNIGAATGTSLSVTGNITGANVNALVIGNAGSSLIGSTVSVTGNVSAGNVLFDSGIVSGTGNITSGNLNAAGLSLSSNVVSALNVTGNITGANLNAAGLSLSSNVVSNLNVTANIAGGNISTAGAISAAGNIAGGNILATANLLVSGYGKFSGTFDETIGANTGVVLGYAGGTPRILFGTGNTLQTFEIDNDGGTLRFYQPGSTKASLTSTGDFSAIGNITGANLNATGLSLSGNVVSALNVTGNITGANLNAAGLSLSSNVVSTLNVTGNITSANLNAAGLSLSSNVVSNLNVTGNITGANLNAAGLSLSSNVVSDLNVTGNIAGGNISTAGNISAGNINITSITGSVISVTGNITGANLNAAGLSLSGNVVSALNVTGNITGANVNAVTNVSATGNIQGNNFVGQSIVSSRTNVATTTNTIIDSFPIGSYRTAKYVISAKGDAGYQSVEALLVQDGNDSFITIYGSISTISTDIISLDSNIVSGSVKLYATTSTANTTVNLLGTYVTD